MAVVRAVVCVGVGVGVCVCACVIYLSMFLYTFFHLHPLPCRAKASLTLRCVIGLTHILILTRISCVELDCVIWQQMPHIYVAHTCLYMGQSREHRLPGPPAPWPSSSLALQSVDRLHHVEPNVSAKV